MPICNPTQRAQSFGVGGQVAAKRSNGTPLNRASRCAGSVSRNLARSPFGSRGWVCHSLENRRNEEPKAAISFSGARCVAGRAGRAGRCGLPHCGGLSARLRLAAGSSGGRRGHRRSIHRPDLGSGDPSGLCMRPSSSSSCRWGLSPATYNHSSAAHPSSWPWVSGFSTLRGSDITLSGRRPPCSCWALSLGPF